jgi:hypothetical protein
MPLVDQRLIEKGRNGATPAAKMRNHFGKSPGWKPYLLRFLDLRWITALLADAVSQSLGRPIHRRTQVGDSLTRSNHWRLYQDGNSRDTDDRLPC